MFRFWWRRVRAWAANRLAPAGSGWRVVRLDAEQEALLEWWARQAGGTVDAWIVRGAVQAVPSTERDRYEVERDGFRRLIRKLPVVPADGGPVIVLSHPCRELDGSVPLGYRPGEVQGTCRAVGVHGRVCHWAGHVAAGCPTYVPRNARLLEQQRIRDLEGRRHDGSE